jgi:predicted nucleic acid-binding protein
VVDASALAAVLFGEPEAERIAVRLADRDLLAPTLLPYEVGSVGLKKVVRYPAQREAIREALGLFTRLDVRQVEVPLAAAVELAELETLTVYDAAYLWLARTLGCELVTLDRALDAAARVG